MRSERLKKRPLNQVIFGIQVFANSRHAALGLSDAYSNHLLRVIPFVGRAREVKSLETLQPDKITAQRPGEHFGNLGFADAGLALQQQRPAHLQGKIDDRREFSRSDIITLRKQCLRRRNVLRQPSHFSHRGPLRHAPP